MGKSLIATALCRVFRQDGYRVAPFKAQNMSLNSFVTADGAEIGRAQAVQADAAEVEPTAEMNPVLLKPEVDYRSQLVVMGRPVGHLESRNFNRRKEGLWDIVTSALDQLRSGYEVVVIEGAGSPAEINLRQGDIVNMEVALYAQAPVILVGDIDKGGVFASLYGTMMLLAPEERDLVAGTLINKFRGDVSILRPGLKQLKELTGVPVLGVLPYFTDVYVPEEDSPASRNTTQPAQSVMDVAVIALPHISNFDDFDPLAREEGVSVRYIRSADELGSADLVVLPGTKTTIADLEQLRTSGIAKRIKDLARDGTPVIGICGGYQMMGERVLDPEHVESDIDSVEGLGLLPATTRFEGTKETHRVDGRVVADRGLLDGTRDVAFEGYDIHMGRTELEADTPRSRPFKLSRRTQSEVEFEDGLASTDGWIVGSYVHGLFQNDVLRRRVLWNVARKRGLELPSAEAAFSQAGEYDKLADYFRANVDMDAVRLAAGIRK